MIETALISSLTTGLIKAWKNGSENLRRVIVGASLSLTSAAIVLFCTDVGLIPNIVGFPLVLILSIPAALVFLFASLSVQEQEQTEQKEEIKAAEDRFRETPEKPAVAWEVARLNLQSYINRNLSQVGWIFTLILLVMFGGFGIICFGIWEAFTYPDQLGPSVVAAASGIIVQFIGATFLVIYRSTNEQASEYVSMLERINAVGMSAQLLEGIDETRVEMRDQARIELAKSLLTLYGQQYESPRKKKLRVK